MTSGEKRFARRLGDKLEDDYLCWYDVSIGRQTRHPDFVVFHPSRGLLILEVKDWRPETIQSMDKQTACILTDRGAVHVLNPLEQARQYLYAITAQLERDPQLVWPSGSRKGKPFFPYGHGVVLANITRRQFDAAQMHAVIPEHLVICQDEMTDAVDTERFQKRLWDMFPVKFRMPLSLPQIDRIRWHMFPEVRIAVQSDLFGAEGDATGQTALEIPNVLRVMDLQQEQLARSLGNGHRVIHGVAGSGKTLILGYRAEHLAAACTRPILVLCYNKTLASKLGATIAAKKLESKVHVVSFHAWCTRQLKTFNVGTPQRGNDLDTYFADCVDRVIRSVENKLIPSAQYDAVLIDEGHDFRPEWFKLIVQMVNPETNSLLVLYDDAQSIYGGAKKRAFSFSSVGVQAAGRTTILKLNYRNTAEILSVARAFADELLSPVDTGEDEAPTVQPMSTGRRGAKPLLIRLPSMHEEIEFIAKKLEEANRHGMPWNDMAVLYRHYATGRLMEQMLTRRGIPREWQQGGSKSFTPMQDSVKIVTMHSSKGLEFPLVCIPGVGTDSPSATGIEDEARLLYVAMTRATDELIMTYGQPSPLLEKMEKAMGVLAAL